MKPGARDATGLQASVTGIVAQARELECVLAPRTYAVLCDLLARKFTAERDRVERWQVPRGRRAA